MGGHAAGEVASEMAVRFVARELGSLKGLGAVKPSDVFLLASDGLTGMLDDLQLAELLGGKRMPEEQVDELIGEANRHGGLDNITAIVVRVDAVDGSPGKGAGGDGTQTTQPGGRSR